MPKKGGKHRSKGKKQNQVQQKITRHLNKSNGQPWPMFGFKDRFKPVNVEIDTDLSVEESKGYFGRVKGYMREKESIWFAAAGGSGPLKVNEAEGRLRGGKSRNPVHQLNSQFIQDEAAFVGLLVITTFVVASISAPLINWRRRAAREHQQQQVQEQIKALKADQQQASKSSAAARERENALRNEKMKRLNWTPLLQCDIMRYQRRVETDEREGRRGGAAKKARPEFYEMMLKNLDSQRDFLEKQLAEIKKANSDEEHDMLEQVKAAGGGKEKAAVAANNSGRGGVGEAMTSRTGELKRLFQEEVIAKASKAIQDAAKEIAGAVEEDGFFVEPKPLGSGRCGEVRIVRPFEGSEAGWAMKSLLTEFVEGGAAKACMGLACARREMLAYTRMGENNNIVKAWAMDDAKPSMPIVMELADTDLFDAVDEGYGVVYLISLCYNVACGLLHMHLRGLVHCDIKPDNILIFYMADDNMVAKLSDFGLTLAVGEERSPGTGTIGFSPPENFRSAVEAHPNQDSYSMGCLLFMLLVKVDIMETNMFCCRQLLEDDEKKILDAVPSKGKDGFAPAARTEIEVKATMRNAVDGKFEREMLKPENLDEDVPQKRKVIAFIKKLLSVNPNERPRMSKVVDFLDNLRDEACDYSSGSDSSVDTKESGNDAGSSKAKMTEVVPVYEVHDDVSHLMKNSSTPPVPSSAK